jgi:hypothetical protein
MADRRPVKKQHERAVVRQFLAWLNMRRGTRFEVIGEPDPPEAIIRSVRVTRWVEVTDAFRSDRYAEDLYSYATPGEEHQPVGPGPFNQMDGAFAQRFVNVLSAKLKKRSYLPFLERYGAGYLIVPVQHPWFHGQTVREMKDLWRAKQPITNLGCFKEVYIAFPSMNRLAFRKWRV